MRKIWRWASIGIACAALASCGQHRSRPAQPDPDEPGGTGERVAADGFPDDGTASPYGCAGSAPGCACDPASDAPIECHSDGLVEDEHGRLRCMVGQRACVDGVWGACAFTAQYDLPQGGRRAFDPTPDPCGNCDPACAILEDDFTTDPGSLASNGTGIVWDPGGPGIVIASSGSSVSYPYAYIGLESTSQVAKIDTRDGTQVGRYTLGIAGSGASSDPSRTAVDSAGNVYVAMRSRAQPDWHGYNGSGDWASVAKIGGEVANCIDFDGSTIIETSTDENSLGLGNDECVLWEVAVNSAAGGHLRGLVIDAGDPVLAPDGYPWAFGQHNPDGGNEPGHAYQLDPDDGSVLTDFPIPLHVYGATVDGGTPQRIWLTSRESGRLMAIVLDGLNTIEGPFAPPLPNPGGNAVHSAYGIGIDQSGRIWRAGYWSSRYVHGYDPATASWCLVDVGINTAGLSVRVNPDSSNTVWVAKNGSPGTLYSFDPDVACVPTNVNASYCTSWPDGALLTRFQRDYGCSGFTVSNPLLDIYPAASVSSMVLPAGNNNTHGLGIAADGRVWAQNRNSNDIYVWDPNTSSGTNYPVAGAFGQPYSYSDFTGYTRNSFALAATAEFWRDFGVSSPACPVGSSPVWGDLTWTAITTNSQISFYAVASTDPTNLDTDPRQPLGVAPADSPPIFVNDLLPVGLRYASYLRIVAVLESLDGITSPVLQDMSFDWDCLEAQ